MKAALRYGLRLSACVVMLVLVRCTDPRAVLDQNARIDNRNWAYVNKIKYDVSIEDTTSAYNLYLNLRVTADYKYSNLFALISEGKAGAAKMHTTRYEFKLANPDGEWLGKGSGNLYSYQIPFKTGFHFPGRGVYHFEIEQNMRNNPLREVSDVGLRVEKATE
ncbi:gliding motility lipoprotein GldH [Mucilaginibacter koreensis]